MSIPLVVLMYAVWSSVFSLGKMALQILPTPLFDRGKDGSGRRSPPRIPRDLQALRIQAQSRAVLFDPSACFL